MSRSEFDALVAQGYNRIPLIARCYADLDTPLSIYFKLANQKNTFLLESVVGGERSGRYSFIGLPSSITLEVIENRVEVSHTDSQGHRTVTEQFSGDPLAFIEQYHARFKVPSVEGSSRFFGGLAGYFGYDTVRYIEGRLEHSRKPDDLGIPDILLMLTDRMAVVDNIKGTIQLIVFVDPSSAQAYEEGAAELNRLMVQLRTPVSIPLSGAAEVTPIEHNMSKDHFFDMVAKAKDYIAAGDVMQVVIGQRLSKRFTQNALSLYRALRSLNPSPYLFYYNFGDFQVVGSSPEILVRQDQQADQQSLITLRPIAGTRPRGSTVEQDLALADELLADPKEIAEHVMLIDLARNDVGRIAQTGSVQVTEKMVIERYSHVMHIVSNVQGVLRPGLSAMDVLRATFPAGTLSGAPKVRAMEIIDELEPTKRGVYGGACGYLSFTGTMDVAIAIRSGVVKDNMLYVQAGAGVVADSVADSEWLETENKARAVMRAAELVQNGLDGELS
ncbi:anthranilate synthase component I [Limnobacter humi]|uniref:Anthranilate synthase component 1 n=1 Tax=Limnobacter humi TaxID=1778671 RepID=A0ABT1WJA5_9BURK|nr:anthranilate synthase component I [Limnobacter humi]